MGMFVVTTVDVTEGIKLGVVVEKIDGRDDGAGLFVGATVVVIVGVELGIAVAVTEGIDDGAWEVGMMDGEKVVITKGDKLGTAV